MPLNDLSEKMLMEQARLTAQSYMLNACIDINNIFEDDENYAKEHPELVAAYMQVAAADFNTAMRVKYGFGGDTLDDIATALSEIATAIGDSGELDAEDRVLLEALVEERLANRATAPKSKGKKKLALVK